MAVQGSPLVILAGAAGVIAVGVAGFFAFQEPQPVSIEDADTPPATATPEAVETLETAQPPEIESGAATETQETTVDETGPDAGANATPEPPSFDIVRVEPDGEALIAGNAAALSIVSILLDGTKVAEAEAGSDGKFVSFLSIAPRAVPQVVSLMMTPAEGGGEIASVQTVILAPAEVAEDAGTQGDEVASRTDQGEEATQTEETLSAATSLETVESEAVVPSETAPEVQTAGAEPATSDAQNEQADDPVGPDAAPDDSATIAVETVAEAVGDGAGTVLSEPDTALAHATPATGVTVPSDEAVEASDLTVVPTEEATETVALQDDARVAAPTAAASGADGAEDIQSSDTISDVIGGESAAQREQTTPSEETAPIEEVASDTEAPTESPQAPAVLLADDQGIRVLQSQGGTAPEVMATVALDSITYNAEGDVLLAGRGTGDGFVRIYLDNQPITTSRIQPNGTWSVTLPQVDTGVYTLRVDQVDAAGEVTSRIESPFKREATEVVAAVQAEEAVRAEARGGNLVSLRTVQPGATLWAIARESYGEGVLYVKVFEANKDRIRDPDLIYPGQVFVVPN
jgi:nucleoid-associated protein YgaU